MIAIECLPILVSTPHSDSNRSMGESPSAAAIQRKVAARSIDSRAPFSNKMCATAWLLWGQERGTIRESRECEVVPYKRDGFDSNYLPVFDGIKERRDAPSIHHIRVTLAHGKKQELHNLTVALTGTQVEGCMGSDRERELLRMADRVHKLPVI